MQIQRWQTVFLFLAAILAAGAAFAPIGTPTAQACPTIFPLNIIPVFILTILIALLLIINIFLYNKLKLQMQIAKVLIMLELAAIICCVACSLAISEFSPCFYGYPLLMALSVIATIAARNRMLHDYRLLRSADRLR